MLRSAILFILILLSTYSKASHIVGGDIYYDYLGNNNYRFYITVYRDCLSTGAAFDDPLSLGIYTQNNSQPFQTLSLGFPGSVVLPVVFNNPCVTPPTNICVEKAVYTVVVNLPPIQGGYTVSYQRCCRGPNITNLSQPDNTGLTLTAHVPGIETGAMVNSSPRFTNYPPLLLCNNDDLIFDHSATDPDGDQLVYSLVSPWSGANSINPAPVPPPGPPYFPVTWGGTFNAPNPLGPGASISIDPTTGVLTASPQLLGLFVVGIRVQEYRNGVLIGETLRDFLFRVFNCSIALQAVLPTQEQLPTFQSYCQGLTVQFENNSFGGTNYAWDFGVNGITSDVSTAFEPTYTYPANGTYQAMLVVNPGWPCTDTAYMSVTVNNEFNVSYSVADSVCITNNALDFFGATDGPAGTQFNWIFGPTAIPTATTGINAFDIEFYTPGWVPVTLEGNWDQCEATYLDSVYLFPEPIANIQLPTGYECEGLTIDFNSASTGVINYAWDFGVPGTTTDQSSAASPTYTFPSGGTYTVTLIGSSNGACADTVTTDITVNELLTIAFTHDDSLCITNNSFDFDGAMTGPSFTTFLWNFGPNASIPTSTDLDVFNVIFDTNGTIPITLTAQFDNCIETATSSIFIFREPSIDFSVEPGPHCAPADVQFFNESAADSPYFSNWFFGDGSTSTIQNPSHVYTQPGSYSPALEIYTTEGCIDTLYLMLQDSVIIRPSPVAGFTVDPKQTDICHPTINFTDLSLGGNSYFYWLDDENRSLQLQNFSHDYQTSGWKRPMQIVTNEFGCKDTAYQELYIEPFVIYIPNTFTPDNDEFNNTFNASFALEVFEWEMKIYSRWGELLFESTDPFIGWDGTFGNLKVQEGAYTYVIRYVSCEKPDSWQELNGHLYLLK
jgi:gliding motility-associated-like protein